MIFIRLILAVLWLIACSVWLAIATFGQGLLPWEALAWEALAWALDGNDLGEYFLTALVVTLPTALLLCGRYNHGFRDGILLLVLLLLLGFAVYQHQESATVLSLGQVGCIILGVVTSEAMARLLGMWLDAPEVRSARRGLANGGRTKSTRRSSRRRSKD